MQSENFFDLAHGQPLLRQPASSTLQWKPAVPLVCPARFIKTALESDSGDADHHSGTASFLIGIIPEH
jgi:hypothetical protein